MYDYSSLPRIADDREIDVVYVVVPTALHAKYAIMAAEAGTWQHCEHLKQYARYTLRQG